jgi:hypothetical protein
MAKERGHKWYQSIGHAFAYIPANFEKNFYRTLAPFSSWYLTLFIYHSGFPNNYVGLDALNSPRQSISGDTVIIMKHAKYSKP